MTDRDPALDPFNPLVGTWATEATHPMLEGVAPGEVTFEWLEGGRFLVQRSRVEHELFPDSISVVGAPETGDGLVMEYFDPRGVRRTYGASLEDGVRAPVARRPGVRPALRREACPGPLRRAVAGCPDAGRLARRRARHLPARLAPRLNAVARTFDEIDEQLRGWIERQPMFFVGTAPLSADGHVNVSPKGPMSTFAVLGPRQVAYLDFYGSGAETIAHVRENGRIVVMLCAFEGPPQIVRLHGTGRLVWPGDEEFPELAERGAFEGLTSVGEARRAIVVVDVTRIARCVRLRRPAHGPPPASATTSSCPSASA